MIFMKTLAPYRTISIFFGIGILLLAGTACGIERSPSALPTEPATIQRFAFSSGGAYHPEGLGEWQIQVEPSGVMEIQHILGDQQTDFGSFNLTSEENANLWMQIEAANFQGLRVPERLGIPDEVQLTFTVSTTQTSQVHHIWLNDLDDYDTISALVDQIAMLIETYTREEPILK